MEENGVTVHMFDRDLQEVIIEANKEFIAQALERTAAAHEKNKTKLVTLSPLEDAYATAEIKDLSTDALEQYRVIAGIGEKVDSAGFNRRLVQQGLLRREHGHFTPTGFGLLLFGKEPRTVMSQAGLLGTIQFDDGTEETRDFDGPQVLAAEQALQWLRDKLPNPIDRSRARRRELNKILFELVREGVVNALVHRDYAIEGAKCQLAVTSDTITVKSPGRPLPPITLEQMQAFNAPMLSRNPILHYVFAQMELAEERGLGLKSIKQKAEHAELPLPKYAWRDPYLELTLFRTQEAATQTLTAGVLASLSSSEQKGWQWLSTKERVTTAEYENAMGIPNRTAKNHIKKLVDLGLLQKIGAGPATFYKVMRQ